jgi:hypothetical protein
MRDVAPDVVANTHLDSGGRLVVIAIDDGSFQQDGTADLGAIQKARAVARSVVDGLGASDLTAVLFTSQNGTAQNFTVDRRLLKTAIDKAPPFQALPARSWPCGPDPAAVTPGATVSAACVRLTWSVVSRSRWQECNNGGRWSSTSAWVGRSTSSKVLAVLAVHRDAGVPTDMLRAAQAPTSRSRPSILEAYGSTSCRHSSNIPHCGNHGRRAVVNNNDADRSHRRSSRAQLLPARISREYALMVGL